MPSTPLSSRPSGNRVLAQCRETRPRQRAELDGGGGVRDRPRELGVRGLLCYFPYCSHPQSWCGQGLVLPGRTALEFFHLGFPHDDGVSLVVLHFAVVPDADQVTDLRVLPLDLVRDDGLAEYRDDLPICLGLDVEHRGCTEAIREGADRENLAGERLPRRGVAGGAHLRRGLDLF